VVVGVSVVVVLDVVLLVVVEVVVLEVVVVEVVVVTVVVVDDVVVTVVVVVDVVVDDVVVDVVVVDVVVVGPTTVRPQLVPVALIGDPSAANMLLTLSVSCPEALIVVTVLNVICATLTTPVGAFWFVWNALKRVDPVVNVLESVFGSPANWLVWPPAIETMFTAVWG